MYTMNTLEYDKLDKLLSCVKDNKQISLHDIAEVFVDNPPPRKEITPEYFAEKYLGETIQQ